MKLVQSLIVAAALAIPAVSSFAQSSDAAAPTHVQTQQVSASSADVANSGFGGAADGSSASGVRRELHSFRGAVARVGHEIQSSVRPDANDGMKPVFFGS
ncbi:hypothetical protein P3T18_000537 [Paraburkholderia sp. GAS199]|uniref:hypothetical protein n=1 Tax=Paraburkholderia sp. GAS199 TaxID=3035126 RepID=UPI003D193517